MKIATPQQMRNIDKFTIEKLGIPGIILMENAALQTVNAVDEFLDGIRDKDILIFAGKGNNGGDGFAVARHLSCIGAGVHVYTTCRKDEIKGDAKTNLFIIEKMGIDIIEITDINGIMSLEADLVNSDIIIDAIFGTGLSGHIDENIKSIIHIINSSGKPVISVDIPSGIDGRTGMNCGDAVNANMTVTFGLLKTGLIIYPGSEYTGRVVVADIGIPEEAVESEDIKIFMTDSEYVRKILPPRHCESNKGDFGKCFLITGSEGMTGAGILAGKAAYRIGAGLVYIGVPNEYIDIYEQGVLEAVTKPYKTADNGSISAKALPGILDTMIDKDAVCIGPGMGRNDDVREIVEKIVKTTEVPLIIDADAINVLSENKEILKKRKSAAIITPHPGEMSRLTGMSVSEIQGSRIKTAVDFAEEFNVITILKGAGTVTAFPDGRAFLNSTGNPGMASGGSGDVLSGILLGLLGQGIKPEEAAVFGTYLHGLAGDIAAESLNEHTLMASDITERIPDAIKKVLGKD